MATPASTTSKGNDRMATPAKDQLCAQTPRTANVTKVFRMATVQEMIDGERWYADANAHAKRMSPDNVEAGAGVLAALSPMMGWDRNVALAYQAFETGKARGGLGANCAKANKIMAGVDPLDVLGGDKVRNFYAAIADPTSETAVVIDRHAFDIAVGRVTNDLTRKVITKKGVYQEFAHTYEKAAKILSKELGRKITPAAVQAVTWVTWRRIKGIAE